MHEWALAEAVLESIRAAQERRGSPAVRATIRFGELQSIDQDIFSEGLNRLQDEETGLDVLLEFETEPARFACTACHAVWLLADCNLDEATMEAIHFLPEVAHSFLTCPGCGSADFRVEHGRGVSVHSVEFAGSAGD